MIIQPGIAKANMGVSREDVTFEDHVSRSPPRGRRLRGGERGGLWSGLGPWPQRTGAAGLGPLWAPWNLLSAFACSAPVPPGSRPGQDCEWWLGLGSQVLGALSPFFLIPLLEEGSGILSLRGVGAGSRDDQLPCCDWEEASFCLE